MKHSLLELLACPDCGAAIVLEAAERDGDEVVSGELRCSACPGRWPIQRGIPRFVGALSPEEMRTAESFGYAWTAFSQDELTYEGQFLDWIAPVDREAFRDKVVLDAGCGKGRHLRNAARFGARHAVGVDLSRAVEVAYKNTRELANAHVIQGSIERLPLRAAFDYAYSLGVVHHLPDPARGVRSIASRVRPGGSLSLWVYGRENNGWIVWLVDPVRTLVTSRLPFGVLRAFSRILGLQLWLVLKLVYAPLGPSGISRRLFYGAYLTYISGMSYTEVCSIVFDHLVAPIAVYLRRDEARALVPGEDFSEVSLAWHNENSWRLLSKKRA
jgi:SAM-dependent methyltransferase